MFDERFTNLPTAVGTLYILADKHHVIRIGTQPPPSMGVLRCDSDPLLLTVCTELHEYFCGQRRWFDFSVDTDYSPFYKAVYRRILQIPYGKVSTAAIVAREAGFPHSVRAVEMLCATNPLYLRIPTHRVLCQRSSKTTAIDDALRRMEQRYTHP